MSTSDAFTIATVLYGGEDVLHQTLPTWDRAVDGTDIALVVIDNSPGDQPAELVRRHLSRADLLRRPSNPGFAASANEALRRSPTEWTLLLNPDVFLDAAAVAACRSYISGAKGEVLRRCAAISLVTREKEHCGVELNGVGYFSDRPAASRRPPLGPSGGAMLIHRGAFELAGGFDDDLFAWGEDGGLSLRLRGAGVRIDQLLLQLPHVGGHSVPSLQGLRFKAGLLSRNRIRIMRRDWTRGLLLLVGPAQLALILANGVRKIPAGTAGAHFKGIATALTEKQPRAQRPRFGVTDFLRYRAARLRP